MAPISCRSNLEIIIYVTVSKIILDKIDDITTARNVAFKAKCSIERKVRASYEAIRFPKILKLSDIGDESLLNKLCITIKVDSPNVRKSP